MLKIKDVNDNTSASFYFGKRVAYIYKVKNLKRNTKFRTIWGTISKCHGKTGLVRTRFLRNLPPKAMGQTLRVMLYPNRHQE